MKAKKHVKRAIALSVIASTTCYNVLAVSASPATLLAVSPSGYTVTSFQFNQVGGDYESAYATWQAVANVDGYHVYYKQADQGDAAYKQLDDQLVRQYSTYFRADVVGIPAGDYVMKVVPVKDGKETANAATTERINVLSHVREGFAFSKNSTYGTGSGGYNDDGSVPDDAQIIYITKDTANTVSLDVITDDKGKKTTCTGIADILAKRQKAKDKRHLIIRMVGLLEASDINGLNGSNYLQLKGCHNVTFEGIGNDATASGWSFLIRDARNVEIRNIGVMLFKDDGISMDTNNENIWVHNNDIFYGAPGSDSDQVKGDGSCDVKGKSTYVTVSYNHFYDSGKSSLCGMSDSENFYVSYHHNWFDHSDSRHPRIRVGTIHIYNNYFDGNSKYGVGVTKGSSAFVEANAFRNCKYPMLTSLQGSDIATNSKGTFSGEPGGMIKAYNNKVEGATGLVYANEDSTQFDAYLATDRNEKVPSTYKSLSGSNTYNNFDTNSSIMYSYAPTATEDVVENVTSYAGRMTGGDLNFTFNNAVDDESYVINTALKNKLTNYKSDLVSVGGDQSTDIPVVTPTIVPTATATVAPTVKPTATVVPTVKPTMAPTATPEATSTPEVTPETTATAGPTAAPGGDTSIGDLTSTGSYTNLAEAEDASFKNVLYVAPNGSATATGTLTSPLDLETALTISAKKDNVAILMTEGTYAFDHQLTIPKTMSGAADAYNVLKACKGANVTLDFSSQPYSNTTANNARGLQLNADYWYVGGITIYGAADNGMMLSGSHNIIERCTFDSNRDTGLQISRSSSSVTNYADWPSYNSVLNCTSKNNCDPATYENADGFAAKLTCGDGNIFDGCISHNNSDDGWDLYAKTATGPIGVVTIKNCIAMRNGITENGTTKSSCDGNGFKLGGSGVGTPHVVVNCLAVENLHHGFTDNNNPSALTLMNCTAFDNNKGGSKNNFSLYRCKDAHIANCVSYTTNKTSDKFMNLSAEYTVLYNSSKWYKVTDLQAMDTSSKTGRGEATSTAIIANDFVNAKVPAVGTNFDNVWRNADGTVNTNGVAIITADSAYADFSTDGGVIGTRFTSNTNAEVTTVPVAKEDHVVETPAPTQEPTQAPAETPEPTKAPVVTEAPTQAPTASPEQTEAPEVTEAPTVTPAPTETPVQTEVPSEMTHNFTTDKKASKDFSISGNLSTSKGTVNYNGLSLTTCLKMESSTTISFTAKEDCTLTLVFNSSCNKAIVIDDTEYKVKDGVLQVALTKGKHVIKKEDSNVNLYYIKVTY
ncbi:MAG: right-handed parallel beta-helix repeat-containing protein [bacterium]|nr:right-handed parallel beta-helix repeat-containing protein [bacterium]